MIPLFKSHFSIGKSILTLNDPTKKTEGGTDSIFSLLEENKMKQLVLVEDSPTGFLQAKKMCEDFNLSLVFGLRLNVCSNMQNAEEKEEKQTSHKLIVFAKNDDGCKLLNRLYTSAFTQGAGYLDSPTIKRLWQEENVKMAVPFYDSFIFNNLMTYNTCIPDFSFTSPAFFIEENGLPFDSLIKSKVEQYCKENQHPIEKVKSVYYNKREDFEAFQTYKCICSRSFTGRNASLAKPQLDHCGSAEFSLESWKESVKATR
jgi:DNA polymerase III alpha subunit